MDDAAFKADQRLLERDRQRHEQVVAATRKGRVFLRLELDDDVARDNVGRLLGLALKHDLVIVGHAALAERIIQNHIV